MANDRLTQLPVEAVIAPTNAKARATQEAAEVVIAPTSAKARQTQLIAEVVILPSFEYTDAATVVLDLQPLVVEEFPFVQLDLQASGIDSLGVSIDSAELYLDLQPSSIEFRETLDSAIIEMDLQASGTDVYSPPCLIFGEGTDQLRWAAVDADLRWNGDALSRWQVVEVLGTGQC